MMRKFIKLKECLRYKTSPFSGADKAAICLSVRMNGHFPTQELGGKGEGKKLLTG
jgi:hypothetical protein